MQFVHVLEKNGPLLLKKGVYWYKLFFARIKGCNITEFLALPSIQKKWKNV